MSEEKNPDMKKGFPGGFFLFLLAVVLIVLTVQSISQGKMAKVGFSYEVEHLVNLDMIQKEDSRKVALNDNLVTFAGKFRERETEEGKQRFRYLDLLDKNHKLALEEHNLHQELSLLRSNVIDAAEWFLALTGIPIPKGGFQVVSPVFDTPTQKNGIVIESSPSKRVVSLRALQETLPTAASDPETYGKNLLTLIQGFRSPALGVGSESMKEELKRIEQSVTRGLTLSKGEQLPVYAQALADLSAIAIALSGEQDNVSLLQLRSVRNYKLNLEKSSAVAEQLEKNVAQLDKARQSVANVIWFFNNKELSTRSLEKQDSEVYNQWFAQAKQEWESFPANKGAFFSVPDQPRNLVLDKSFKSEEPAPNYISYFITILPVLLIGFLLYFVFSRQMKGVGSNAMNFGKSPAKLLTKEKNKVTFKDVAGCDESKEELQEIVDFLKDPAKFTALGARIPKGVLCIGAPGTGKTLIAKAVAGEADRPFFSISGSDFVEMFVGVGASRIRDLFEQAKKFAPCIIFIDEIDAVGRHRGAGIGGGHDEREQTLNQLLVEMDGFDTREGVILIAATNRPDVLDKALLRPGRFDRRVVMDLPDIKGRFEILKVHGRKIKLDASVDLMNIARNTPGASGADLENILNEAALLAARRGRNCVTAQDAEESCDKVRYGKERRSLEVDLGEKKTTAYHESGHAVVALCLKSGDPVDKVTIIPRGLSLGATHFMPRKNRLSYWRKELLDQLAVLMGGRVAEALFVGDVSSGAQMDFTQATRIVRSMVCEWGMTDLLGPVAYDERSDVGQYLGGSGMHEKKYSEATAEKIDQQVHALLEEAHQKATTILETHRKEVELMTEMLIEFETLNKDDVLEIMEGTWDTEQKRQRVKATDALQKNSSVASKETINMDTPFSGTTTHTPTPQQI